MLKCWAHDPLKRPKFSEIYEILPDIKPEQLKTVSQCIEMKKDHLTYRQGDIITVLDKSTNSPFWLGVLNSGRCGLFNPANTVAHIESLPSSTLGSSSGSTGSQNQLGGFIRNTLERNSKRKLKPEMISSPQNDFKHTGHVGIDGAYFGNVAFLSNPQTYNKLPRQVVTPYKPSEDLEHQLLLPPTPTSPGSATQTGSAYFSESSNLLSSSHGNDASNHNDSLSSDFQRIITTTRAPSTAFSDSNPFAQSDHQLWTTDMGKNFTSVNIL